MEGANESTELRRHPLLFCFSCARISSKVDLPLAMGQIIPFTKVLHKQAYTQTPSYKLKYLSSHLSSLLCLTLSNFEVSASFKSATSFAQFEGRQFLTTENKIKKNFFIEQLIS